MLAVFQPAKFQSMGVSQEIHVLKGRIAFLFKAGREARVADGGPTEFFYGYVQLRQKGYDAEIVTDRELDLDTLPARVWRSVSHMFYAATGVPLWPIARLARSTTVARLNAFDCLVVSTNTFGVCLGLLCRLNVIQTPVLFLAIGLIEPTTPARVVRIYRWIFGKRVSVCALTEGNARLLSSKLDAPIGHIPFGVDTSFWTPAGAAPAGDYVLSIGNDSHRDYATLLRAWRPSDPRLRVVTSHPISSTAANVEIIRGGWHHQVLTDEAIRTLVQNARFVILPIRETIQPSGQSACLQAMACAKTVVITDFSGLWNRELLRDGDTCLFSGAPGDHDGIRRAVDRLAADSSESARIGANARRMVESALSVEHMAAAVAREVAECITSAAPHSPRAN
ncbi:MAG: glycosyltransferase family 4 protein [Vicinamibacterales bacterium]|jgi:hypothetical protein